MGATNIDLGNIIDPTLLQQATVSAGADSIMGGPNATTGTSLSQTEVIGATNEDQDTINTDNLQINTDGSSGSSLLSSDTSQSDDQASDNNISSATDSASIDVDSVTPAFVTDEWKSQNWRFSSGDSTWQENTDGTFTQNTTLNTSSLGLTSGASQFDNIDVSYKWDAEGNFIGLADGTEQATDQTIVGDFGDGGDGGLEIDEDLDNISTINTDPIELDNGNFAYAFDANQDGEIDTYRITDASGTEIETISSDQFTGTNYSAGTTTTTVGADNASTDGSYLGIINPLADDDVWKTGSEDTNGDGIPDGVLKTGISAEQIQTHTFADGSKGFIFTVDIPDNEITGQGVSSFSLYWNENGQLVDSEGKGAEGMVIKSDGSSSTSDGSDDTTTLDEDTLTQIRSQLSDILVDTNSDITDDFATLFSEVSSLFASGDDGILTADDQQQLLGFFNTMISQGNDTGVILSSKTMTDYFNLVKEYTGQFNGTISDADLDNFLADWLSESVLFNSALDNSQKWSLDNITEHSQYESLGNLIELVYGEGRTLTAEEAMRYLTDYSWQLDGTWTYGVGGASINDQDLSVTNFLVQQMVLNARGTDQEYVTSFWLGNEDLDLEAYGLTIDMIAEAWGTTVEELKINTAKAKKDKNKKKSTGSFFAPKDVVRIGDEDPGSSLTTITGRGGRSRTKPKTLLGGSVMTSTLTGSN